MYGLLTLREYLDEIFDRLKTYGARSYDIRKRGTIDLVDIRKSSIIGYVDIISTHPIFARKYCDWQATGKWAGIILQVEDMCKPYYAYDFKNSRRLNALIKVIKNELIWIEIDDKILR